MKIKIDLKVPKGWQMCSTRELEMIAEEMIRANLMAAMSRFRPFDWTAVKTRLFFRFSNVQILDIRTEDTKDTITEEQKFACRLAKGNPMYDAYKEEFELATWQVHSFLEQLAWIDAVDSKGRPVPMPKLMWPYPKRIWWLRWRKPDGELLDGMSWQTYRLINDWMEAYSAKPERSLSLSKGVRFWPFGRLRDREMMDIRLTVLGLMFGCPKWRVRLARISDVEWQVILFWWSSMMQYLKEQYPKCFKQSDKKSRSKTQPLPIELYTRSMATLQKYLGGLTEAQINQQSAHAILRHMNDMAVEAEQMEKLRRKKK